MKRAKPDFDEFYSGVFAVRWPALRAALEKEPEPAAFSRGLCAPYYLDPASIAAALCLGETGNARVLDMCAAPGGKTLVLASTLGPEGAITANERSAQRRARLVKVLDEHLLPAERARVSVTGHDAARWGLHEKNAYDSVLLDAPCSSERHLLLNPAHLESWSPARIRHLAQQAYAMLLAALAAAKPGGRVLYSTCALCDEENDGVVRRALKRLPGGFTVLETICALPSEKTLFGRNIRPDAAEGAGPIYFALLEKRAGTDGLTA
ncbi:MAG: RsmB/NOP family class I SAM-dependent RNA methyltransferase [Spirochaetales bacterium]|jgi:16S rRNA C967 or C1407 C5-methylase (RsmB/RsmF family)|nr:RsmB/NOP family class I SAM-dependent RNA methyltransferase [Spirochaetales bacterium]